MSNKDLPLLGPLDEDDEFEEFEVQGESGVSDDVEMQDAETDRLACLSERICLLHALLPSLKTGTMLIP